MLKNYENSQNTDIAIQMKKIIFCVGLIAALLGGLWLLQGMGLVNIRPILCFADCVPVQEPSATWAITGALALAFGGAAMFWSIKRRTE